MDRWVKSLLSDAALNSVALDFLSFLRSSCSSNSRTHIKLSQNYTKAPSQGIGVAESRHTLFHMGMWVWDSDQLSFWINPLHTSTLSLLLHLHCGLVIKLVLTKGECHSVTVFMPFLELLHYLSTNLILPSSWLWINLLPVVGGRLDLIQPA